MREIYRRPSCIWMVIHSHAHTYVMSVVLSLSSRSEGPLHCGRSLQQLTVPQDCTQPGATDFLYGTSPELSLSGDISRNNYPAHRI
jgi:hypothetical protein